MAYILVADDDELLRDVIEHHLHAAGHEVGAVGDGEQLVESVSARVPDAIVLDAMMPVRSGMETLFTLKEQAAKLNAVYTAQLKLRGDSRALEAAIDDATESAKKNGKTLDENTPKGRANAEALDRIAAAGLASAESMDKVDTSGKKGKALPVTW